MSGPYPPHQGTGAVGPPYSDPHPNQPTGAQPAYSPGHPDPYSPNQFPTGPQSVPFDAGPAAAAYPGSLPPPVPYPKRRSGRVVIGIVAALATVGLLVAGLVLAVRARQPDNTVVTAASSQRAIQGYLDALAKGDIETIARNALCGLYDGVRDRRSDNALAKLSSDAFQKQVSSAKVTSVDTIVFASPWAAQVLFTMQVVPAMGGRNSGPDVRQGVAQVLAFHNEILVCSYLLRTAGMF
jgi:hypothetical protein